MTDNVTLTTRNLTVGYKNKPLLKDINVTLSSGDFIVLMGANGKGKSTLLKSLYRALTPLSGTIIIEGKDISEIANLDFARLVSIVNTERTHATLTAYELVSIGRQPYTGYFGILRPQDKEIVESAMEKTGINSLRNRKVNTLSDGEHQKVMIARALAQLTPIILLDEPTSFLDVASRIETMQLLHNLAQEGKAILLSTHDVAEGLRVATGAWLAPAGEDKIISGTIPELINQQAFDHLFPGRNITFDTNNLTYFSKND